MDMLHYAKTHKPVTVLPPQSSSVVPLNDPFKTSVPAKYGHSTFRAPPGLFYKKLIFDDQILSGTNDTVSQARKSS